MAGALWKSLGPQGTPDDGERFSENYFSWMSSYFVVGLQFVPLLFHSCFGVLVVFGIDFVLCWCQYGVALVEFP